MRLIDADKLRYEIDKHYPFTKLPQAYHGIEDRAKSELLLIIHEAPVVDAVEVVRCKDCVYGEYDSEASEDKKMDWYFCNYTGGSWNQGKHFCSYGERKSNEAD